MDQTNSLGVIRLEVLGLNVLVLNSCASVTKSRALFDDESIGVSGAPTQVVRCMYVNNPRVGEKIYVYLLNIQLPVGCQKL